MKMARKIVDEHADDGPRGVDRDELADHVWGLTRALSPLERMLLVAHGIKELSFREIGKREHRKRRDVEQIFDEVCKKIRRMFERFGTQSL